MTVLGQMPTRSGGSARTAQVAAPQLPQPRGPLSAAVLKAMREGGPLPSSVPARTDPYGDDLQLALYCGYELHYRGFAGVDDDREWDLGLLRLRAAMEDAFLRALREEVEGGDDVDAAVGGLLVEPVGSTGVSHHLKADGELWQVREYIAQRSLYHLKEADPQAWVIPRLDGDAKSALVTVEHDEYGAGRGERMHSRLFAEMMGELGLSTGYGAYLDHAPAVVLAEVNLMSLCGLRRSLRGASVGQFAVVELTSSPGSARLVAAARRIGCGPATERFYAEHVEADAVHEQVLRRGVLTPLLTDEPLLAADVVFGIQASLLLGDRFGSAVLRAWQSGRTSLVRSLPDDLPDDLPHDPPDDLPVA